MKTTTSIFLLFISMRLLSQTYYPFLNNSSWYQKQSGFTGSTYFWYNTEKDTNVNGIVYKKVIRDNVLGKSHLVREDVAKKQVYAIRMYSSSEILLYDFSLKPGDPFLMDGSVATTVTKVDSIMTKMGYRKRFTVSVNSNGFTVKFIEGVGSQEEPFWITRYGGDPVYTLVCSRQNSQQIYFTSDSCAANPYVMNIDEENENKKIIISPNPFTDLVRFEVSSAEEKIFSLFIHDALGRVVKKLDKITTPEFTLDRNNMENGIYFYELKSENTIIGRGKLIVK